MQKNHFLLLKKFKKYRKCPALRASVQRKSDVLPTVCLQVLTFCDLPCQPLCVCVCVCGCVFVGELLLLEEDGWGWWTLWPLFEAPPPPPLCTHLQVGGGGDSVRTNNNWNPNNGLDISWHWKHLPMVPWVQQYSWKDLDIHITLNSNHCWKTKFFIISNK